MPDLLSSENLLQPSKTGQLRRPPNSELRDREYLTPTEIIRLLAAAKKLGRNGQRNYTFILISYRHGLRVGEAIGLKWSQINFDEACLHVKRLKQGKPATHPISGTELRALRQLRRSTSSLSHIFNSERESPLTDHAARALVRRAGQAAGFDFVIHPHMLRHSCGYYLANEGHDIRSIQDYLGHRAIQHTIKYTELAPGRFENFWKD